MTVSARNALPAYDIALFDVLYHILFLSCRSMWHHLTDISNGTSGSKAMPRMVIVEVCRAIVFHWNCVYTWLDCVATIILQHWCLHYIVRGSQSNCGSRMLRITELVIWRLFNEESSCHVTPQYPPGSSPFEHWGWWCFLILIFSSHLWALSG